jgi:hypothetical protein
MGGAVRTNPNRAALFIFRVAGLRYESPHNQPAFLTGYLLRGRHAAR